MFEKIIKIKDSDMVACSCIVRLTSPEKNSYQFELDRIALDNKYQDLIDIPEQVNTEDCALLFEGFGYTVEFIEPELTIEI